MFPARIEGKVELEVNKRCFVCLYIYILIAFLRWGFSFLLGFVFSLISLSERFGIQGEIIARRSVALKSESWVIVTIL